MLGPVLIKRGLGHLESETPSVGLPGPSSTTVPSLVPTYALCRAVSLSARLASASLSSLAGCPESCRASDFCLLGQPESGCGCLSPEVVQAQQEDMLGSVFPV